MTGYLDQLRARADAGDWSAGSKLADLPAAGGEIDQFKDLARAGSKVAAERLAEILAAGGEIDELRLTELLTNRRDE
jgi:hypothetical protein